MIPPKTNNLSPKELATLKLIAEGCTFDEIAAVRLVALGTVKNQVVIIRYKLEARNVAHAVAIAKDKHLI